MKYMDTLINPIRPKHEWTHQYLRRLTDASDTPRRAREPTRTHHETSKVHRGRLYPDMLYTGGGRRGVFTQMQALTYMGNTPNSKQAANRHHLGQFQSHMALRGGKPRRVGPSAVASHARGGTIRADTTLTITTQTQLRLTQTSGTVLSRGGRYQRRIHNHMP